MPQGVNLTSNSKNVQVRGLQGWDLGLSAARTSGFTVPSAVAFRGTARLRAHDWGRFRALHILQGFRSLHLLGGSEQP